MFHHSNGYDRIFASNKDVTNKKILEAEEASQINEDIENVWYAIFELMQEIINYNHFIKTTIA